MDGIAQTRPMAETARSGGISPVTLASTAFVLIWCTGYIAGKTALLHSGAFSLLVVRFGFATLGFVALALFARVAWPAWRDVGHSALVGILSLALQFGAVYLGVQWGASVGVAALVIGAMPLVTTALAPWIGEKIVARQWLGVALGFIGVVLVLADRLSPGAAGLGAYIALILGLLGISIGTLYQKHFASRVDARVGLTIQHAAATLVLLPLAMHEHWQLDGSAALIGSLGWLVVVNSLGGFALLFALLQRGAASRVATLFFLIPPVTAVLGYLLLGEQLSALKLAGFALAAIGVRIGAQASARPISD